MPSPPLVVPQAVQVRLIWAIGGNLAINVLHARKLGTQTIDQTLTNVVGAAIKVRFAAVLAGFLSTDSSLEQVSLRDLGAPNQTEYFDTGAARPGTDTGEALPPATSSVVTMRTGLSGKSHRGRVYVGGFTETYNAATGVMTQGAADASVFWIQGVAADLNASGLTLGVLSRPAYAYTDTRNWQLPNGTTEVDVTGRGTQRDGEITDVSDVQSLDLRWDSQRRRGNGRGSTVAALRGVARASLR